MSWSGGKDAAWALHELQQRDEAGSGRSDAELFRLVDAANARLDALLAPQA